MATIALAGSRLEAIAGAGERETRRDAQETAGIMTALLTEPEVVVDPVAVAYITTFDDLLTRFQTELYRYALQLTRNRTGADDLFQETLLKAFRAFDRLDGAANHRAWLYRIMTNTFLNGRRRSDRERPLDVVVEATMPSDQVDHAASIDARELLFEVATFVDNLPTKQRAALVLRKYQEMGYNEIAAILDTSEGAARANVHEALRKLRERFDDRLQALIQL
jgi:RNA polymerase sigma-70 factor, ECF subfamily